MSGMMMVHRVRVRFPVSCSWLLRGITRRVWDIATGQELLRLQHDDGVLGVGWNADETRILTWSEDRTARLWGAVSGKEILQGKNDSGVPFDRANWSPDEQDIFTWGRDGESLVWDVGSGQIEARQFGVGDVLGAVWNDKGVFISWRDSGDLFVGLAPDRFQLNYESPILGALWNPGGNRLAGWLGDNSIRLWQRFSSGPEGHSGQLLGAEWNAADTRIVSWDTDGSILMTKCHRELNKVYGCLA